jgi:hypothetical protein
VDKVEPAREVGKLRLLLGELLDVGDGMESTAGLSSSDDEVDFGEGIDSVGRSSSDEELDLRRLSSPSAVTKLVKVTSEKQKSTIYNFWA